MSRRYTILGLSAVFALALAIPALGGPSNPIATGAATAKQKATKALKKANQANSAAQAAQTTANQALAAANTAQSTANAAQSTANAAQTTANGAQTDADTVTAGEMGRAFTTGGPTTSTSTAGLDVATDVGNCPGSKLPVSAMGLVQSADEDPPAPVGTKSTFIFYDPVAIGQEYVNTGNTFDVTASGICVNP